MFGFAADGMHFVAGFREDRDGQAADAAAGAADGDRPQGRRLRVLQHPVQRQAGGESGGAEDHAFAQAQAGRQGDGPGRLQSDDLAVAAVAGLGQAAAGAEHGVAFPERRVGRSDHVTGHVDAADQREASQDLAFARAGQRVLEVDAAMRGPHDDLAGAQRIQRKRFDAGAIAGRVVVDAEGAECGRRGIHHEPAWATYSL